MSSPRHWARRTLLSALAGGGLTAVSLGGPMSGGALGADVPTGSPVPGGGQPGASTTPDASAPVTGSEQPSTTTSTTPSPSSTSATPPTSSPAPVVDRQPPAGAPTVAVQRKQKTTSGKQAGRNLPPTGPQPKGGQPAQGKTGAGKSGPSNAPAGGPNGVAPPPQAVAGRAGTLAALLAGSAVSAQALDYYRIPLFLLPIYQAAGIQYGVPWQILAAINEVETNYGSDQSVSTAGAVGWMQFMPETWLQYGVDATNAGYADPYNPVDAIFAAARYLHAAGASSNMHTAILAYNHSEAYVSSVLLRAKLIAGYPESVIATLTGLTEGRLPTAGARVAAGSSAAAGTLAHSANGPMPSASSSATANAMAATPSTSASAASHASATPGSSPAPSPAASVAKATNKPATAPQLVELLGAKNAAVVAVQDGRIVTLGRSRKIGNYVVLRDIYGDVFTYAGLGSVAPNYRLGDLHAARASKNALNASKSALAKAEPARDPVPRRPASAGHQPITLRVKTHARQAAASEASAPTESESAPPGMGNVRLFAHPNNPDALAATARVTTQAPRTDVHGGRWRPLRRGSVVSQGTVLGGLRVPPGARAGHMRFAIRPAGDSATIDPRAILANWKQLDAALHPQGAKSGTDLLGATAADVFLMSKGELERTVLSDPSISIYTCGRQDIAAGMIDKRVLALLAFLSRSGLAPTVSALHCGHNQYTTSGNVSEHSTGDAVDISAVNGIPIAGHQGPGTITDITIRALLTLQGEFVPHQIISLMQYPGAPDTLALPDHWNHIHVGFHPVGATVPLDATATATVAHSAASGRSAPSPLVVPGDLSATQWNQLIARIAALPAPTVATKPSTAAIRDPQAAPSNRGLGARQPASGG